MSLKVAFVKDRGSVASLFDSVFDKWGMYTSKLVVNLCAVFPLQSKFFQFFLWLDDRVNKMMDLHDWENIFVCDSQEIILGFAVTSDQRVPTITN